VQKNALFFILNDYVYSFIFLQNIKYKYYVKIKKNKNIFSAENCTISAVFHTNFAGNRMFFFYKNM